MYCGYKKNLFVTVLSSLIRKHSYFSSVERGSPKFEVVGCVVWGCAGIFTFFNVFSFSLIKTPF